MNEGFSNPQQELLKRKDLAREIGRELRDLGSDRLQELLGVIRLYKLQPITKGEKTQ